MLRRKIETVLMNWKENRKQALLVTGARQIGKSYSIERFIDSNFEYSIKINFSDRADLIDSFAKINKTESLILLLSLVGGNNLIPGKTVVFFDEIQLVYSRRKKLIERGLLENTSLDIISAMKPLSAKGEYKFILSGSLLGVEINDVLLNPTGYMDSVQMFPLDFEEFLWAKGVGQDVISYVESCYLKEEKVMDAVNDMLLEYFREYVLVGGMPESVEEYISKKNLYSLQLSQEQIVKFYHKDITTYIDDADKKLRVRDIYDAIPSELNGKNKRFVSTHVVEGGYIKRNSLEDEFLWLTNAAVAIPVYNVTEATIPLSLASERKTLKLFLSDTGLLTSMLVSSDIRQKLLTNEKEINYGAPYENAAATELNAHGFAQKLYYYNSKKHGEVDFIIEYEGEVLPIEIKSGKPDFMSVYNHTALNNIISKYDIRKAYIFGNCNVKRETNVILQLPIYMISFVRR
ncbi:MAG: DUF4143 domain-containing protein [Bacilli bacterium]|nr:DUF4143 domain-containing protein [Bacilli bacterium]